VARRSTVVFVALAAADTLLAATGRDRQRWLTKPLLMPVLMAGRDRPAQRALALGGAGDVALLGSSEIAFTAGLVSFLVGHVAWIIALRQRPGGGRLRARPALAAPHVAASWLPQRTQLYSRAQRTPSSVTAQYCRPVPPPALKHLVKNERSSAVPRWA